MTTMRSLTILILILTTFTLNRAVLIGRANILRSSPIEIPEVSDLKDEKLELGIIKQNWFTRLLDEILPTSTVNEEFGWYQRPRMSKRSNYEPNMKQSYYKK